MREKLKFKAYIGGFRWEKKFLSLEGKTRNNAYIIGGELVPAWNRVALSFIRRKPLSLPILLPWSPEKSDSAGAWRRSVSAMPPSKRIWNRVKRARLAGIKDQAWRVKRRGSCSAADGDIQSKVIAYYYSNVLCEAIESMCARLVWCRRVPGERTVVAGPWRPLKSIREEFARLSSLLSSGMLATSSVALPQVLYYYRQ